MNGPAPSRAWIIGSGLIGGSIGLALRKRGWHVTVTDADPAVASQAVDEGVAHRTGPDEEADVTFVCVPVGDIPGRVQEALAATSGIVTDVGSTKESISHAVRDPRFIGGHPMAGSEQDGLAGADADLFAGATWVLTPSDDTGEATFATLAAVLRSFGCEVISLDPQVHDRIVAEVSHVPHLTAATLMCQAAESSIGHRALLRLAAGGFRDMTRISSGRPTIWPDICVSNRDAIVHSLDGLIARLSDVRDHVQAEDREGLLALLQQARHARINLPTGYRLAERVAEVAVPIPDRPGEIAAITTLASELDVNILDIDISHSAEGRRGVMLLMVDADLGERLMGGLMARGYHPSLRSLD